MGARVDAALEWLTVESVDCDSDDAVQVVGD